MKKNIAIITESVSDFSLAIEKMSNLTVTYINPNNVCNYNLDDYYSICILGGTKKEHLLFNVKSRNAVEEQIIKGKKIFCEYALSIDMVYSQEAVSTRFKRLICTDARFNNINAGDILEDQCNDFLSPYFAHKDAVPLLIYKDSLMSHSNYEVKEEDKNNIKNWALWQEKDNLMLCAFRMCNFLKARFSPINRWKSIIRYLLNWITDENPDNVPLISEYQLGSVTGDDFISSAKASFSSAINWFEASNTLIENGNGGVYEGFCTEVYADGTQRQAYPIRTDCSGEVSMVYMVDYLMSNNKASLEKSDNLQNFCYNEMQIKEGLYKGMLRWTNVAWEVCYQDDMARVMIPTILKIIYLNDKSHIKDLCMALDFLVKTTGKNGLRPARTDNLTLNEAEIKRLSETDCDFPSAHYNAFYHACLAVCGKITDNKQYIDVAVKGLSAIMAKYPKTYREQSETQELCRLVLPLSWLYWSTKNDLHKEWIYTVVKDLQKMRHKSGAYLEWDSDYSAGCSKTEGGECSLLTCNGDPVVDLLYSVNWLPLGFIQAYLVTGDNWFYDLWKDIVLFFISAQIKSDNKNIDGSWARGFDVDLMEVYGLPNDVGWGPWAIESGWTVAEIASGIGLGIIADNLKIFY